MKIAVTGYRGRLGSELVKNGCVGINARINDFFGLRKAIESISPDVIIHCAAMTNVDGCENSPKTAMETNFLGTCVLSDVFDGKIVYLSTDYIFDGRNGPYDEYDLPNPIGIYGMSKLAGELVIKKRSCDLIIRTTILFDDKPGNFVTKIAELLKSGLEVHLPDRLIGTPTYVPHLAQSILKAIENDYSGIINIVGNRLMSRYEIGVEIARMLNVPEWKIQRGAITGLALRPPNAGLYTAKAENLNIPIYDPLEAMKGVVLSGLETVAV